MKKIQTIAVFTSTRAEYGLLKPLLHKILSDGDLNLQLIVGGSHLEESYGRTIKEIEEDDIPIAARIPFIYPPDELGSLSLSMAKLQGQIGPWLGKHKPDLLMILGDRAELLPVAAAALVEGIPVAHISGGETTEGAIDNQVRHAVTKLSHLHFPATETYKRNIMKMGEEPWRICVSGEPGLDDVLSMTYYPERELYDLLGIPLGSRVICATFHPETIANQITPAFLEKLFPLLFNRSRHFFLFTASNFDRGGSLINDYLMNLCKIHSDRCVFHYSLGKKKYYSLLKNIDLVLGNSSSGLVEAQSFNVPVVNVGKRQKGRLANKNVINVDIDVDGIEQGIEAALSSKFRKSFESLPNLYGDGKSADRIIDVIKNVDVSILLNKTDCF